MTDEDPTLEVARDLAAIVRLHEDLGEQAVYKADDKEMPGGDAMVMLGPVASLEAVFNRVDGLERYNAELPEKPRDDSHVADLDLDWEPPLQSLLFWSEQWRVIRGMEIAKPTVKTEAVFLIQLLTFAYQNEAHWSDFAKDIHAARMRLEAILRDGERTTPGIRCPKCQMKALVRVEHDRSRLRDCGGHGHLSVCPVPRQGCCERGGLIEEWSCPKCHERYDLARYQDEVMRDYIANAPYLEGKYLERRLDGVKWGTVRVWTNRGLVKTRRNERDEMTYCIADIKAKLGGTGEDEVA